MTMEMSEGILFEGMTMNAEISASTKTTAESTYTMGADLTITTSCPVPPDWTDNAIGYWVFVVDNNERTATAIVPNGVCRYGEGYWNVAPNAPFDACIDDQCIEYRDWH